MFSSLRQRTSDEGGFTLIELLVVILIIGILAAIAIPSLLAQKSKAYAAGAKSLASSAQTAAETYGTDNNGEFHGLTATVVNSYEKNIPTAASGNNARVYRLDSGFIKTGHAADIVLLDAPDGGTQSTALAAINHGDIAAIGAVVTAGVPRFVGRSRNTPATTRKARVVKSKIMQDFSAAAH